MQTIISKIKQIICAHNSFGAIQHPTYTFWGELKQPQTVTCAKCGKAAKTDSEIGEIILEA